MVPAPVNNNYSTPPKAKKAAVGLVKKVEFSPNSMAKCKSCQKKIEKKSERIGIPEWYPRYHKHVYHYYHLQCCPDDIRNTVPNIPQKLEQQQQADNKKYTIVGKRYELVVRLKELRMEFAKRLDIPAYYIFSNEVLNEIVAVLPGTNDQLLNVRGIGPAKLQSFGTPILSIIRQYKNKQRKEQEQEQEQKINNEDNDEAIIAIGETLTCEQLVQQKFDHATANGYIIEI
jgi:superfamily II DNA helicase RecQ